MKNQLSKTIQKKTSGLRAGILTAEFFLGMKDVKIKHELFENHCSILVILESSVKT